MLGAIILAGGHGRRMGGTDKASLSAHGTRFIDRLLAQLPYGTPAVAVSPHYLGLPQVCESPLYGGPVAGIAPQPMPYSPAPPTATSSRCVPSGTPPRSTLSSNPFLRLGTSPSAASSAV